MSDKEWLCPDDTLHMAHVVDSYPRAFKNDKGQIIGVFADFFIRLAQWIGCSNGMNVDFFTKQRGGYMDQLLQGNISNRNYFAVVAGTSEELYDVYNYTVSAPAYNVRVGLYQKKPEPSPSALFAQYIGFESFTAIFVLIAIVLSTAATYVLDGLLKKRIPLLIRFACMFSIFFYSSSILLFGFFHSGIFTGNSIDNTVKPSLFAAVQSSLKDGSKKLILNSKDLEFEDSEFVKVIGNDRPPKLVNSTDEALLKTCEDSSFVVITSNVDVDTFLWKHRNKDKKCEFERIDMGSMLTGIDKLDSDLRAGYTMSIVMPLGVPQRILDKINRALRTVLSPERVAATAVLKYGTINREVVEDKAASFVPYHALQTLPVIIVVSVMFGIAGFILLAEWGNWSRRTISEGLQSLMDFFPRITLLFRVDESDEDEDVSRPASHNHPHNV